MNTDLTQHLAEFPVVITLPVQWGDQDAFGHVNNVVCFRWYESARIDYLKRMGLGDMAAERKIGPILASIQCDYRRQITFPDTVQVGARVAKIGRTSLTMEYRVVSEAQQDVVAEGTSTIVVFDYQQQRPRPVPDEIRSRVSTLEGREL